ncbi:MAG: hypothetical protein AAF847_12505 [Bacteroidota bacterium]
MKNLYLFAALLFLAACSKDSADVSNEISEDAIIWTGSPITFSKAAMTDANLEENQDRISENVWITRATGGGQIYNAKTEDSADKDESPEGTLWAVGDIDDIENLSFQRFRAAVGNPQNVVGKELVLFLEDDDIYLSVKFTAWGSQGVGSFAYERSTEN